MKETTIPKIIKIIKEEECTHNDVYTIATILNRVYVENSIKLGIQHDKEQNNPKIDDSELKKVVMGVGKPEKEITPNTETSEKAE